MLRTIVRTTSSKICTTRTTSTSSLYRCSSSLRTFCGGAVENNNKSDKETNELRTAANTAIHDLEKFLKEASQIATDLKQSKARLNKAMESNDDQQILAVLKDLKIEPQSKRKECTFPTELTASLLHRFGGKPSVLMGRYLRVYQMKMLKYQVDPHDVSDWSANHTLARAIVSALVLGLFIYL